MNIGAVQTGSQGFYENVNTGDNTVTASFSIEGGTTKKNNPYAGNPLGIILIGSTVYCATYAEDSTAQNPKVRVGDYEICINDVNPSHATGLEIFAYMSYLEDTNQITKEGMSSYSKLNAYAGFAQDCGFCSGIYDEDSICNKKQDWTSILNSIKKVFLNNSQTYQQALTCDKILNALTKAVTKNRIKEQ